MKNTIQVGIIMGSQSDLAIMKEAADILTKLEIGFELQIVSAHRTPELMFDYAKNAADRGLKVIIAGAGGAADYRGSAARQYHDPVLADHAGV